MLTSDTKRVILTNRQGFKVPHEEMVKLRYEGKLNLGIENDLSTKISGLFPTVGPDKTLAVAAFHFWNWVAIAILLWTIYWSFVSSWWWFILGLGIMQVIWSANKVGNAENFLDAAMIDKDFYERVLDLKGWMYQLAESDAEEFSKYFDSA